MIDISAFRTEPDEPNGPVATPPPPVDPATQDANRKEMAVWRDILDGANAWAIKPEGQG